MATGKALYRNARVYTPGGPIKDGYVLVGTDGVIEAVGQMPGGEEEEKDTILKLAGEVDCGGMLLVPGFIDIHVHGGGGFDVLSGLPEELDGMSRFHAEHGTTAFLATTATVEHKRLLHALSQAGASVGQTSGAELCGIHLEGPFICKARRGAQSLEAIRLPDPEIMETYLEAASGNIRLVTLAPEVEGGLEAVRYLISQGITVSAGHTDATYEQMRRAVEAGVSQTTHHFNGMRPMHHREPGAAGAGLLLDELTTELICDGVHVHPAAVKLLFDVKRPERVCLITDALFCAGLPDGSYGDIVVRGGENMLADGSSLAGSSLTMLQALRNALKYTGRTLEELLPSLTSVPARQAGLQRHKGELKAGKHADFLLLDAELQLQATFVRGQLVYRRRTAG
ncbi:N-acetylglucosamine-6-phosphate deacetylase [Paenibacillus sp. UNCCL117]|uniref:N-acetylglucosamine-6-phosphate deacetylase n=1 Tax=unclassified Paenibacillus TaxID=185978 RepID=UPI00088971D9|nr:MULTISPECIES: N-acetylglucosamine-6-phosphate deacetylase [unclassified Paenibacillus]SDD42016.1 N-acetylglucosamine 6-phosphate deacetylase [Paenibacillus sp. cl123]SFW47707.1 N-acetylglucosamine-6-phosphate deacetylase [Paenibacillus sp. UNCCL117]